MDSKNGGTGFEVGPETFDWAMRPGGSDGSATGLPCKNGIKVEKTAVDIDGNWIVKIHVTHGHDMENGGSGGARTRNLCRDRAAL
jgi:hypothetical protein